MRTVRRIRQAGLATLVALLVLATLSIVATSVVTAPPVDAWGASRPAPIPSVSAGGYMSCGVQSDGTAACWGENGVPSNDIAQVHPGGAATPPAGVKFLQVNTGYATACGVKQDGAITCWGNGRFEKVQRIPTGQFKHVAPGLGYICALRTDDTIACWGGDVPTTDPDQKVIRDVPAGQFSQVTVGNRHACALRSDGSGRVLCWGHSAASGSSNPITGIPAGEYISVNAASNAACAVRTDGTPVCWGGGGAGQREYPKDASGNVLTFTQIATGTFHACGLRADGTVACWGRNAEGQVSPVPPGAYTQVSAGNFHTCGMRVNEARAVCWGNNMSGRVQPNMNNAQPPRAYLNVAYRANFTMNPSPSPTGIPTAGDQVGVSPAPTFSLLEGELPPGLAFAPNGVLSGTPTAAGSYVIKLAASNGLSPADCAVPVTLAGPGDSQTMPCVPGDTTSAATATRAFTVNVGTDVPAPGVLTGRLTSTASGDPAIGGATVSLAYNDTTAVAQTTTDTDGRYAFTGLSPDKYRVTASGEGFSPQTKPADVASEKTTTVDFSLTPRLTRPQVVGVWSNHWQTVSDGVFVEWSEEMDMLQQVGARYSIHDGSDSTCTAAAVATGRVSNWLGENPNTTVPRTPSRIRDVEMTGYERVTPGATYHLRVAADTEFGKTTGQQNVLTCMPFVAELRPMDRSSVAGTVTNHANAPIPGAAVSVKRTIRQPGSVAGQSGTNASGSYIVSDLPPSSYPIGGYRLAYSVLVEAPGYASKTESATTTFNAGTATVAPATSNATLNVVLNALPVAGNDAYTHYGSDTALVVAAPGVLGNDTDAENDSLAVEVVRGPGNGTVTLNPNGSFTYQANEDFVGTDSFTYKAKDATGESAPATVTITVGAGCRGQRATITGTNGPDRITGTKGNDVIAGLGGDDIINAAGGNDVICGGSGKDGINAGGGDDYADGGSGDDSLRGDTGNDTLFGGAGADMVLGDDGDDVLSGGAGSPDSCQGGAGTDSLAPDHGCEKINGIP